VLPKAFVHVDNPVKEVGTSANTHSMNVHAIHDFIAGSLTKLDGDQVNFMPLLGNLRVQFCYMPSDATHNAGWKFPS
jgi:hypothetical protein